MVTSPPQLRQHLKQHGQSLTKPRRIVFAALQGAEPQTMQQLVIACPSIDRASVYRAVALFERLGIVQRLQIGWKYKLELSDTFSHHHHHLTCLKCGRMIPFGEDKELENKLSAIASSQNFKMQGHQLEIQGLCNNCQKS
jgi:Fur family ferric uptake transcriptional regulator